MDIGGFGTVTTRDERMILQEKGQITDGCTQEFLEKSKHMKKTYLFKK